MSFALTTAQVLDQSKDVTRRMGWLKLKPGDTAPLMTWCENDGWEEWTVPA